jgi:glycosyltransferase involved in cell wall biosynthesis
VTERLRILTVLTYYYPHWTGLTAYARLLAEGLARRGHDVTVLTARYGKELPKSEMHNGVRIVRLEPLLRISRGVVMPAFPLVVNRLMKEHDVIQIHAPLLESPLITTLARRHGKKVVFTHHGDLVMPSGPFDQFVELVVTALMRHALKGSARVTIHTQDYAENSSFLSPFRDKLVYVLPPVQIPEPVPDQVQAWRRELGVGNSRLIGFAGRFVEEKGFDYLLKAIPYVVGQMPDAKFVYAGEVNVAYESFFEKCRHLVERSKEHIIMLGLLRDPQRIANFYAMCDTLALPSRTDCFPMVQVEAMLCGTPTVATDIPGLRVPIRLTGMGRLVKPQDEVALAKGLIDALEHRSRYVKGREEIAAVFDMKKTLDVYESLLLELSCGATG